MSRLPLPIKTLSQPLAQGILGRAFPSTEYPETAKLLVKHAHNPILVWDEETNFIRGFVSGDGGIVAPVLNVQATGTITSTNTAPADGSTVNIGGKVYTFKTTLTPTEGQVLINTTADAALLNLIRAINYSGTPGTDYSVAAANPSVTAATLVTSHAFAVTAIVAGTAGNAIATPAPSTSPASSMTWGATTLTGGVDAVSSPLNGSDIFPDQLVEIEPAGILGTFTINLEATDNVPLWATKRFAFNQIVTTLTMVASAAGSGTIKGAAKTSAAANDSIAYQKIASKTWRRLY